MAAGGRGPDDEGGAGGSDGDRIPLAEKATMAISAAFTVGLFVFALWYAATGPGALAPQATVLDSRPGSGGDVVYTIELRNPGDLGLKAVTVEVACTTPPIELEFEHIPPGGRRVGTVACPSSLDAGDVSVASWIRE